MSALLKTAKAHRALTFLLILEVLFLAGLLAVSLIRPQTVVTISWQDIQPTYDFPVTASAEQGIQVYSPEPVDHETVFSQKVPLPSGAYDVNVQYQSVSNPKDPSYNMYNFAGHISFRLDSNPQALQTELINLPDSDTSTSGRIWLRLGAGADDLTMDVEYYGYGLLAIQQIEFRECMPYRAARILGFLAFFAVIDLVILFFLNGKLLGLTEKKQYLVLGLVAITVFSSLLFFNSSLLNDGDLEFHLNRIASLSQAFAEGQIPQRIQTQMLNGYGYTTPLFYGDLFLVLPSLLLLLDIPLQTAYQVYVVAVNLATTLITYWCLKKMVQDSWKALAGTTLYLLSSYRLLNLILRSAVGEYTAMTFLPLILYGFYRLYTAGEDEKLGLRQCAPLILGFSGIIECHILSCEMVAFFSIALILILWRKTFQPHRFMTLVKAGVACLLLNAWFILPFLQSFLTMKVNVNSGVNSGISSTANFYQLFSLFPSPSNISGSCAQEELSLSIGPAFVILLGAYLCYFIHQLHHPAKAEEFRKLNFFFLFGIAAIFLSSSLIPWGNLHHISRLLYSLVSMIQFAWRYLGIALVCLTFGAVLLWVRLEKEISPRWSNLLLGIMVGVTVFSAGYFYTSAADRMKSEQVFYTADTDTMEIMLKEYLPFGTDYVALEEDLLGTGDGVETGNLERQGVRSSLWCRNSSKTESWVDLPILAYDNYHASLEDGSPATLSTGENNRIRVTLPAGYEGVITVEYRPPVYWRVSEAVSLVTLAGFTTALILEKKKKASLSQ